MQKLAVGLAVAGSIVLTGCFLWVALIFNIGNMAADLINILAKSPPGMTTIMGYSMIRNLTIIDDLVYFEAVRDMESPDCVCIYAADKTTGEIVWSIEDLAKPTIEEYKRSNPESQRYPAIAELVAASASDHRLYIEINQIFYVLNSEDGSVVWNVPLGPGVVKATEREVLLANEDEMLSALDKETGRVLWTFPVVRGEKGHIWYDVQDAFIYVMYKSNEGSFLSMLSRADGKPIWQIPIREFHYLPVYYENLLIFPQFDDWSDTTHITAYYSKTGALVWERETEGTYDYPQFTVVDDQFFIRLERITEQKIYNEYALLSFDAISGEMLWSFNEEEQYHGIYYMVHENEAYIATSSEMLFSLDRYTGKENWRRELLDTPRSMLIHDNLLLLLTENNRITVYNRSTGETVWSAVSDVSLTYGFVDEADTGSFLRIEKDKLLIAGSKARIKVLDIVNGKEIGQWKHNNQYPLLPQTSYDFGLVVDGHFFIFGNDGRLAFPGVSPHRIFIITADELMGPTP